MAKINPASTAGGKIQYPESGPFHLRIGRDTNPTSVANSTVWSATPSLGLAR